MYIVFVKLFYWFSLPNSKTKYPEHNEDTNCILALHEVDKYDDEVKQNSIFLFNHLNEPKVWKFPLPQ